MAYNPNQRRIQPVLLDDNLYPTLSIVPPGKYRGSRPLRVDKGRFDVFGCRVLTGNGWHRGQVTRNGKVMYTGTPCRSRAQALDWAHAVMVNMERRLGRERED